MKSMYKVYFNIPETHTQKLIEEMARAGAGEFGNYSHCSFITKGVGTAKPLAGSNPFIGNLNELYFENEDKLEMICSEEYLLDVINAIKKNHPYETPIIEVIAVDVYTK